MIYPTKTNDNFGDNLNLIHKTAGPIWPIQGRDIFKRAWYLEPTGSKCLRRCCFTLTECKRTHFRNARKLVLGFASSENDAMCDVMSEIFHTHSVLFLFKLDF